MRKKLTKEINIVYLLEILSNPLLGIIQLDDYPCEERMQRGIPSLRGTNKSLSSRGTKRSKLAASHSLLAMTNW
jgi:hypothetical protein